MKNLKVGDIIEYKQYMIMNDLPIDTCLLAKIENEEEIIEIKKLCEDKKIIVTGVLDGKNFEKNIIRRCNNEI